MRFINGKDRRDWMLNQNAILGIMPVIIAPKKIADDLKKNYLPNMTTVNTTKYEFFTDKEKFFTDIYYKDQNNSTKTEMVFDRIAYKYTHTEPYENEFRSTIRLGDDGKNALEYWYIGIDLLNVQRADFNYINGTVTLYSPTAYDIYKNKIFDNVRIVYKKEIVYGENIECYYSQHNDKYIITAKSKDKINAVIELY